MIILGSSEPVSVAHVSSGLFIAQEEWIHPKRVIDTYELLLPVKGEICLQEADTVFTAAEGDLLILRPHVEHAGIRSSGADTSFYWVHLDASDFSLLQIPCGKLRGAGYTLATLFRRLLHVDGNPGYPDYYKDLLLGEILAEITALCRRKLGGNGKIQEIAEWIRINSDRKLSAAAVAEKYHYNADYLSSRFKLVFQKTLLEYINDLHMRYLKKLLLTTNLSVKELCHYAGWDNESAFQHYFKYHEKISPHRYRWLYSNIHLNKE